MQIFGPSSVHGPQGINPAHRTRPQPAASPQAGPTPDQLDISAAGSAAAKAADARTDLVAQIKNEIASGTYETPEKLDLALERLLDEIG